MRNFTKITDAYDKNADIENLLLDDYFKDITKRYQSSVREVVALAVQAGVPVPTFSSAIAYFDSYRSDRLPANLIQAQRITSARIRMNGQIKREFSIIHGMTKRKL